MALSHNTIHFLTFLVACLVIQLQFVTITAKRPIKVCPPVIPNSGTIMKIPKVSSFQGYVVNRYKKIETGADAFRPTTPGHSPGIGHDRPPGGQT